MAAAPTRLYRGLMRSHQRGTRRTCAPHPRGDRWRPLFHFAACPGGSRAFWPRSILRPSSMSVHLTRHRSRRASQAFSIASREVAGAGVSVLRRIASCQSQPRFSASCPANGASNGSAMMVAANADLHRPSGVAGGVPVRHAELHAFQGSAARAKPHALRCRTRGTGRATVGCSSPGFFSLQDRSRSVNAPAMIRGFRFLPSAPGA
jgi:hypothetical protein